MGLCLLSEKLPESSGGKIKASVSVMARVYSNGLIVDVKSSSELSPVYNGSRQESCRSPLQIKEARAFIA